MISINNLTVAYGERILFQDVSLQFTPGNCYGIVGANGAGKSTLLRVLSGEESGHEGQVEIPSKSNLGVLQQDHYRFENDRILDVVLMGRERLWQILKQQREILENLHLSESDSLELAELEAKLQMENGYAAESEAAKILDGLGITGDHQLPLKTLSGGFKLRVLMAQLLFSQPDILLLDEPTNHLDIVSIRWLENYLKKFSGTLLVVTHDRAFLDAISTHIVDIDYESIRIYPGNYERFLEQKSLEKEQLEKTRTNQEKRKDEIQRFVDRFRAKATKASQVQSRVKMLEKMDEIEIPRSSRQAPHLTFSVAEKSGICPLKISHLSKSYGDLAVLQNVNFEVTRGEKIALIGPNGIGKSTLLKILMAEITADEGHFEWDEKANISYFPQEYTQELDPDLTLYQWLFRFDTTGSISHVRGTLARVLFSGDEADEKIMTLSGGEASRLILARMILQKGNVMVMDEPTNHLDVEAIDELARALQAYPGTLIVVSHNRYFVSQVADRIIELSPEGLTDYKGTYREYLDKEGVDHLSRDRKQKGKKPAKVPVSQEQYYKERKQLQRQERQLKKQAEDQEAAAEKMGQKIAAIEQQMADFENYSAMSANEQMALNQQKSQLEKEQEQILKEWEQATAAYEQVVETLAFQGTA